MKWELVDEVGIDDAMGINGCNGNWQVKRKLVSEVGIGG